MSNVKRMTDQLDFLRRSVMRFWGQKTSQRDRPQAAANDVPITMAHLRGNLASVVPSSSTSMRMVT